MVRYVIPFDFCHGTESEPAWALSKGERVWVPSESTLLSTGFSASVVFLRGAPGVWALLPQGDDIFAWHSKTNTLVGRIKLLTSESTDVV